MEKKTEYLDDKLKAYGKSDYYPFHMPGHKRRKISFQTPEEIDITEIEGFDNLHHAEGILKEAQERMAETFGADHSFFLINGSTAGLLAAISAAVTHNGRILMARNCHKAVYHAVYLNDLSADYLYPDVTEYGISGCISPEETRHCLEKAAREKNMYQAVVITSPTYDGIVSDVEKIAESAHRYGIPLIVDEAHGAHFGFDPAFPVKAQSCGADYVIESLHKTLPSLTQTAVLHVADSPFADLKRLKMYLQIYQSSSPSYVLMAGMDRCSRILRKQGRSLFQTFTKRLQRFYQEAGSLRYVDVFGAEDFRDCDGPVRYGKAAGKHAGIPARDYSKILICAVRAGLNGESLQEVLLEKYHLQMEMASGHYVTALTSIMDTETGFKRLMDALRDIDRTAAGRQEKHVEEELKKEKYRLTAQDIYRRNEKYCEIAQAVNAGKEEIGLAQAAGRISGDFVYLYPPGIPLLAPGEVISSEMVSVLGSCLADGLEVMGIENGYLSVLKPAQMAKSKDGRIYADGKNDPEVRSEREKSIRICRAGEADTAAIRFIMDQAVSSDRNGWYVDDDADFIEAHIRREGYTLKCMVNGVMAGFLIIRHPEMAEDNLAVYLNLPMERRMKTAHMESVSVLPAFRGYGIQTRLLQTAARMEKQHGYLDLMATVHPDNRYSLENFLKEGYRIVAEDRKYGGYDRVILHKDNS